MHFICADLSLFICSYEQINAIDNEIENEFYELKPILFQNPKNMKNIIN